MRNALKIVLLSALLVSNYQQPQLGGNSLPSVQAPMAQLVERWSHNPKVSSSILDGSIPYFFPQVLRIDLFLVLLEILFVRIVETEVDLMAVLMVDFMMAVPISVLMADSPELVQ